MLTWPILSARDIEASDFHGEGCRKKYGRDGALPGFARALAVCARVMGENGLLARHRVWRNQEKTRDETTVSDKVNDIWGTGMSLEEGRADVFVAVEHANSEIVGIDAARSANRFEALEPPQGVHRRHRPRRGAWAQAASPGHRSFAVLRARTRRHERFIRTLKENLLWVRAVKTIEELRAELVAFAKALQETWRVARRG
jgi:hypothetical protein